MNKVHIGQPNKKDTLVNENQMKKLLHLMNGSAIYVERICALINEFGYERIKEVLYESK